MDSTKRAILLPPPPKLKKESKTYCFELTLGESNDETYPEFSWKELVRGAQKKEAAEKTQAGMNMNIHRSQSCNIHSS
jgi:hypothetical protein